MNGVDATPPLGEDAWQSRVIAAARAHGWRVVHYRRARSGRRGWSTPVQGDAGGPDLLLARAGVVILAELKSDTGGYGPGQREWAREIGPRLYRLWRPRDWEGLVLPELSAPAPPVPAAASVERAAPRPRARRAAPAVPPPGGWW